MSLTPRCSASVIRCMRAWLLTNTHMRQQCPNHNKPQQPSPLLLTPWLTLLTRGVGSVANHVTDSLSGMVGEAESQPEQCTERYWSTYFRAGLCVAWCGVLWCVCRAWCAVSDTTLLTSWPRPQLFMWSATGRGDLRDRFHWHLME